MKITEEQYKVFLPGRYPNHKKEREIKFTEESYLEVLHGLNLAKLKQKDLELTSVVKHDHTHIPIDERQQKTCVAGNSGIYR